MATDDTGGEPGLDLEIRQSERFTRREWAIERVGWGVLAVFVVAGLVGAFGWGPLSYAAAESDGGTIRVEYQRIGHHEADDSITLVIDPVSADAAAVASPVADARTVTVELTGSWVGGVDLVSVTPAPSTEYAIPGGVAMDFAVRSAGPFEVLLAFRASGHFGLDALVAVADDSVRFSQFVMP